MDLKKGRTSPGTDENFASREEESSSIERKTNGESVFSEIDLFKKNSSSSQKKVFIESLMRKTLQRQNEQFFPNKILTKPNDRKTIMDLGVWLDQMIKLLKEQTGVSEQNVKLREIFDNLQVRKKINEFLS